MKNLLNPPYEKRDVAGLIVVVIACLLWAAITPPSAGILALCVTTLATSFLLSSRRDQSSPSTIARIANDVMYLSLLGIGLIVLRDLLA